MLKFQVYADAKGEHRWRLLASNGQTIATSGEGYKALNDCKHAIELIKTGASTAAVEEGETKKAAKSKATAPKKAAPKKKVAAKPAADAAVAPAMVAGASAMAASAPAPAAAKKPKASKAPKAKKKA